MFLRTNQNIHNIKLYVDSNRNKTCVDCQWKQIMKYNTSAALWNWWLNLVPGTILMSVLHDQLSISSVLFKFCVCVVTLVVSLCKDTVERILKKWGWNRGAITRLHCVLWLVPLSHSCGSQQSLWDLLGVVFPSVKWKGILGLATTKLTMLNEIQYCTSNNSQHIRLSN